MTHKLGDTLVIAYEDNDTCEICGKITELRPYGPRKENGQRKKVCFECGMMHEKDAIEAFGELYGDAKRFVLDI